MQGEENKGCYGKFIKEDVPRIADEFEKLIRSYPNSGVIWIK